MSGASSSRMGSAAAENNRPSTAPIADSTRASASSFRIEPGAAAAERYAHRDLPLPRLGANQAEVGDVAARDQQDHADRAEQDPQRLAHAADHVLLHRVHQGAVAPVGEERAIVRALDVFAHRPLYQWLEVRRCLIRPDTLLQPADRSQPKLPVGGDAWLKRAGSHTSGDPASSIHAGATPTTCVGSPSARMARPTSCGSPP